MNETVYESKQWDYSKETPDIGVVTASQGRVSIAGGNGWMNLSLREAKLLARTMSQAVEYLEKSGFVL